MKKLLYFILILTITLSLFGCNAEETPIVKVATLAGPTGMGMTKLIDEAEGKYEVNVYTAPDQITPKIINKEIDICAVPSNLASILYNKMDKQIVVLSINTTGVLYILENGDTINSIDDLRGKTIYASGQGSSPEYILNNVLEQNGLTPGEDITIVYQAEHSDLANMLAAGEIDIAILPEPFVSLVTMKNTDIHVKIDMNEEWEKIYGEGSLMPMGVAIVQKDFLENYPKAVETFMKDYEESINFVINDSQAAAKLIAEQGILPSEAIAMSAIPRSGISFIIDDSLYEILNNYLEVLNNYNPQSIGGTLPDEEFYYSSK